MNLEERTEGELVAPPNDEGRLSRSDIPLIALAVLAAIVLIWMVQMPSSLWLDELGTFWVIDGDLASSAGRAWRFQGQTPLYYAVLWGVTQVMGTSEIVMRLPSLLSMLGAAFLLYRFATRLFGHSAAIVSLAAFIVYPQVGLHASDARPYALALLATLVATVLLESWLRTVLPTRAAWYGLAAAVVVYVHYVFASIFVAHILFFAWTVYRSKAAQRRRIWIGGVWAASVFLLAISPTFPQIANLLARSDQLVISDVARIESMFEAWAPPVVTVVLIGAVALAAQQSGRLRQLPTMPLILIGLSFVTPPVVLFALANVSDVVLWAPRYWFVVAPYVAMLFGILIASSLSSARSVKNATLIILLIGMLNGTSLERSPENWRSALSAANSITDSETTVLLFSGLIELRTPEFLVEPEKRSYVTSPIAYYPVEGQVTPIPWIAFENRSEKLDSELAAVVTEKPVVVIANQRVGSMSFISGWLAASGYERTMARTFGTVRVSAFAPP